MSTIPIYIDYNIYVVSEILVVFITMTFSITLHCFDTVIRLNLNAEHIIYSMRTGAVSDACNML